MVRVEISRNGFALANFAVLRHIVSNVHPMHYEDSLLLVTDILLRLILSLEQHFQSPQTRVVACEQTALNRAFWQKTVAERFRIPVNMGTERL